MPKSAGMYSESGNVGAEKPSQSCTIGLQISVGIESARDSQNLSRNIATE